MSGAAAGAIAAVLRAHLLHMPPSLAAAQSLRPLLALIRAPAATAPLSSSRLSLLRLHSARSFSSSCGARASPGGAVSASAAEHDKQTQSELIFLGTGTSGGIPRVSCLSHPSKTCRMHQGGLAGNRNRRRHTSILLRHATPSGSSNILVDAGKFFYHSAVQWFPAFGLRTINSVIITHSHADAIGGDEDDPLLFD